MLETIIGVVYGILFVILLGMGVFFIFIGMQLKHSFKEFSDAIVKSTETYRQEGDRLIEALKDQRHESEKMRDSQLPFTQAMSHTATNLLDVIKGFERFDLVKASLERNSTVGEAMVKTSEQMMKEMRSVADAVSLLFGTLFRGGASVSVPPVRTGEAGAKIEFVSPPGMPPTLEKTPPADDSTFVGHDEAQAAANEANEKMKRSGYKIDEQPGEEVPLSQMNNAGNA
jgi:hypothetical protein